MAVKAGDTIIVAARKVTPDDAKSGLYYSYFGGLTGTVDRVYPDGSVCVDVDLDSLSEEARARHVEMQEAERRRWLDGLSDEARNRLTAEQKQLRMSYRILVSNRDLEVAKGGKPSPERRPVEAKPAPAPAQRVKNAAERAPAPRPRPVQGKSKKVKEDAEPRRLSEADLEAAEEAFLRSRQPGA